MARGGFRWSSGAWLGAVIAPVVFVGCAAADECVPTAADALGPFYVAGAPVTDNLNRHGEPGEPLAVAGRIRSAAPGHPPVADARVEVWQTDSEGNYHPQSHGKVTDFAERDVDLRGTVVTDAAGHYQFATVVPGSYFPRPRHFHYRVTASGYAPLVTQLYITGDGVLRQPGAPCRHAALEREAGSLRYAAPDLYLLPE